MKMRTKPDTIQCEISNEIKIEHLLNQCIFSIRLSENDDFCSAMPPSAALGRVTLFFYVDLVLTCEDVNFGFICKCVCVQCVTTHTPECMSLSVTHSRFLAFVV